MIERWMNCPIGPAQEGYPYQVPAECGQSLVDITDMDRVYYDATYARMGLKNTLRRCYVRQQVAKMLQQVLELLPPEYSLWIYDTLRPKEVQQSLYDMYWQQLAQDHPDATEEELKVLIDDFVAYPRIDYERPTPHSTGGAVDLTLMKNGQLLPMGTEFDDLTDKANTRYFEDAVTEEEKVFRDNRRLLYQVMIQVGFVNYRNEWWHFAYGDRAWGRATGKTPIYSYISLEKNI